MIILEIFRRCRSRKIGIIAGLSALGPAARQALVDANNHLIFRCKDEKSLREAAATLILPRGAEIILPALKPGKCLFRGPQWPDAALAEIFNNVLPPIPSQIHYDSLPHTPGRSLYQMPHVLKAIEQKQKQLEKARNVMKSRKRDALSDKARVFAKLTCEKLYFPTAQIFKIMGKVPFATQKDIRKELEKYKLIDFEEVRIESSNKLLHLPTPRTLELFRMPPDIIKGRGSTAHKVLQHVPEMVGKKRGYKSDVEVKVPGTNHPLDAAWIIDGRLHGIEAAVHTLDNLHSHIENCFIKSQAVETLTILVMQKGLIKKVQKIINSEPAFYPFETRIRVESILPLFKELWP